MQAKDDLVNIAFLSAFNALREKIEDNPSNLEALASKDSEIAILCTEVDEAAERIDDATSGHSEHFVAPVDAGVIKAWRDYEERYAGPIVQFKRTEFESMLRGLSEGLEVEHVPATVGQPSDTRKSPEVWNVWKESEIGAKSKADKIRWANEWAKTNIEWESEYEGLDEIKEGIKLNISLNLRVCPRSYCFPAELS